VVEGELVRKKGNLERRALGSTKETWGRRVWDQGGVQATRRLLVVIGEARKSNLEESQEKSRATDALPSPLPGFVQLLMTRRVLRWRSLAVAPSHLAGLAG
jgi:hypothetical protein